MYKVAQKTFRVFEQLTARYAELKAMRA